MKKRAFTLIELLVVLAIISTIVGIGITKFKTLDMIKANLELQTMANDINHAKIKAQTTGTSYKLILNRDSYKIKANDLNDSSKVIYRDLNYIEILTSNAEIITYTSTGSVSNANTINLKYKDEIDPKQRYKLKITVAGGHSRIEKEK
ncbi:MULTISPECIES: prepilin-type N-terminal cleavage/methylation domain-containing protein [Anaerococcus]|uniref:Prepilin-type N-terminal cleavage/methylation domain-containing protein n=1 Tax=Anaerococcus nagyae TaxID=1755241 RepID=A0A3E2TJH4_9FIRM|nr:MULTISPECIES: prepilin-type N-terminal cleavage/methylation domain-containing protein [Anaerococcus]MBP2069311.1 prepilin-type N-terminal cleavage/methylation domain-containing protein [Anaerococcus nagyae]MDU2353765.1 prepilin-type N-terminal cleavage/methylation domain-containing protein [Anaerococcus sp.]RGB77136.1 prepilin-type N-terminal cleavage/methylation domain-containing protein [Anaerococcus nagyae]